MLLDHTQIVIAGGDGVSYGAPRPRSTFKKMMLLELGAKLDLSRVHFVMLEYRGLPESAAGLIDSPVFDLPRRTSVSRPQCDTRCVDRAI